MTTGGCARGGGSGGGAHFYPSGGGRHTFFGDCAHTNCSTLDLLLLRCDLDRRTGLEIGVRFGLADDEVDPEEFLEDDVEVTLEADLWTPPVATLSRYSLLYPLMLLLLACSSTKVSCIRSEKVAVVGEGRAMQ
jgi:hypothetical protein